MTTQPENKDSDQQVEFDGRKYLPILGIVLDSSEGEWVGEYTYGCRGWWDDRHFIKMDVIRFNPKKCKDNTPPDLQPALP